MFFPGGRVGALTITALAVAGTVMAAAPATAAPVAPPDISALYSDAPMVAPSAPSPMTRAGGLTARATSQCSGSLFGPAADDARQARNIMAGRFKLGRYGYMTLPANPNWRNQGSLDYSGNGMQHALWWALPLLRVGRSQNRPDLVSRFYNIVDDWLRDNPIKRPRSDQAYGQIESGLRMVALACAAESAGPRAARYAKALRVQGRFAAAHWGLVNNASFHQAAGIFAAGCVSGDGGLRKKALRFLERTTAAMIASDGSVFEGSLEYARATYIWTMEELSRVSACGVRPPGSFARVHRIPNFLAYGVRPDGRYEALGDGGAKIAIPEDALPGSMLEYASTKGTAGKRPPSLYAGFGAGFLFGRSGWGQSAGFEAQTFYSVRTGAGPSQVYHAHSDAGALTVHADGSQLLFDGGPFGGSANIRTRQAHNVVSIAGLGAGSPAPAVTTARSTAAGDLTTLVDRAYPKSSIRRTIWYDRVGDFFVVIDNVKQRKRRSVYQNWNLGRDRGVQLAGSAAHSMGAGGNVSIISVGSQPGYSVLRGSRSPWGGWNSEFYADLVPAPSVRVTTGAGKRVRFVTVIVPRAGGEGPETVSASGQAFDGGAVVTVNHGLSSYHLRITGSGATRL